MMTDASEEHVYGFSVEDFDKSLLPAHARTPGTDAFREEVSKQIQRDFAEFTGWVRIMVGSEKIEVAWRQDPSRPTPMEVALGKVSRGEFADAIRILDHLRRQQPDDPQVLYNLGLALSDSGHLPQAEAQFRAALAIDPTKVDALVALGVALSQQGKMEESVEFLRDAVELAPENPWAHRNLGAMLFASGQAKEGTVHLRRAYELSPQDQQAVFGYAKALHDQGDLAQADQLFAETIQLDERSPIAGLARLERTKLAELSFRVRVPAGVRPDAVAYCMDGLEKFEGMTPKQVEKIGFEIALLGRSGFDTNSDEEQYTLKNLPGRFSGLHLVCLMYVAFQQITPGKSIGFDLSKEYEVAKRMHEAEA